MRITANMEICPKCKRGYLRALGSCPKCFSICKNCDEPFEKPTVNSTICEPCDRRRLEIKALELSMPKVKTRTAYWPCTICFTPTGHHSGICSRCRKLKARAA